MGKLNKNIKAKAKTAASKISSFQKSPSAAKIPLVKSDTTKSKQILNKTIDKTNKNATSKKEKFRQKHKNLMNKFALLRKQQKEEKARKNREKTAIIGDVKPLKDSLPALDEIFKLTKEKDQLKTGLKELDDVCKEQTNLSAKQKLKRKKEKFMRQVNSYQALLKDPDFKNNPREAIRYHIKYTHGLIEEQ